jgi:hypothetical protein
MWTLRKQGGMLLHLHFCRQHNTRHLSFTNGAGGGDGASSSSNSPAGVAASMQAHHQQQQQRSSSSSLQVLASLQLDATLASITQEARHDGALAERLAHWKRAFREKGEGLPAIAASCCPPAAFTAIGSVWRLGGCTLQHAYYVPTCMVDSKTRACKVTHVTHVIGVSASQQWHCT